MEEQKIIKEVKDFIDKAKEHRNEINAKRRFLQEHGFRKEDEYLSTKVDVANEIIFELEFILTGKQKGINSKLNF